MGPLGFVLVAVGIILLAINATITSVVALHWLGVALIALGAVACLSAAAAWAIEGPLNRDKQ